MQKVSRIGEGRGEGRGDGLFAPPGIVGELGPEFWRGVDGEFPPWPGNGEFGPDWRGVEEAEMRPEEEE